jgi:hypothetical protein
VKDFKKNFYSKILYFTVVLKLTQTTVSGTTFTPTWEGVFYERTGMRIKMEGRVSFISRK